MAQLKIQKRSESGSTNEFDAAFAELAPRIRADAYRASLLPREMTIMMLRQPLPKPSEFWLAFAGDAATPVGRVGANVSPVHAGLGYVGFFEVDVKHPQAEKIAHELLLAATRWLKSQGCTRLAGPVDYSTWFTYRFTVEKPSTQSGPRLFSWEPLNPPEYPRWFQAFGMTEIHAYHSQGYSATSPGTPPAGAELLQLAYDTAKGAGFRFRPLDMAQLETREIPLLHRLSHAGFTEAFLFEPLPLAVFTMLYATALKRFDFSPSCIVEGPEGTPVGFNFAFYDGDTLILKTIAVLPEFQKLRLSSSMLGYTMVEALKRKTQHYVSALVKSGAGSEHHERRQEKAGAREWRHDYALYGMELR